MLAKFQRIFFCGAAAAIVLINGCAKVSVEGGDKPIHIVMDINVKVDRELDQFFSFEQPATQPTTAPTTNVAIKP